MGIHRPQPPRTPTQSLLTMFVSLSTNLLSFLRGESRTGADSLYISDRDYLINEQPFHNTALVQLFNRSHTLTFLSGFLLKCVISVYCMNK
jgi:hypothetical protein